jgi:hypothetical protein
VNAKTSRDQAKKMLKKERIATYEAAMPARQLGEGPLEET